MEGVRLPSGPSFGTFQDNNFWLIAPKTVLAVPLAPLSNFFEGEGKTQLVGQNFPKFVKSLCLSFKNSPASNRFLIFFEKSSENQFS